MIILDTNVVSEALRPEPAPQVIDWLDGQDAETLFLTSVSLAELLVGAAYLPEGRRRSAGGLERAVATLFGERVLPFDAAAAEAFAPMVAAARSNGVQVGFADGQIAAIAVIRGFAVATRDAGSFRATGVELINPWA